MPKYQPFPNVDLSDRQWPNREITAPPIWCSVDLRDGNQALAVPMGVNQKLEMFQLLVDIGFKEIEVGFPAASQIDFDFVRRLIEDKLVPDDVYLQVLTQAREDLISRTFESVLGAKNVVLHMYNSTSTMQRKITFNMSREQIKEIAIRGTEFVREQLKTVPGTNVRYQYSPESFSDTELDYALEVCEAVMDVWQPTPDNKMVLNLPATVEWSTPNVHADQIEWFSRTLQNRDSVIISLHTHNDRGTGVAATELGMLAGGERVEGTLFGNGERTGNVDIVTVALNMFSHGVDPGLKLNDVPLLRAKYEKLTGMKVHERHPYAGDLVFTAFSGSHQDAIKKGMDRRTEVDAADRDTPWEVPYLSIDPRDIGRTYEAIIRINSQSGKGGVAYVLSREFGIEIPKAMQPELGRAVNERADELGNEMNMNEIYHLFTTEFVERSEPLRVKQFRMRTAEAAHSEIECSALIRYEGKELQAEGRGNGPISAFVHALAEHGIPKFKIVNFAEQAIGSGEDADAVAFVQIETEGGVARWGAGIDSDITMAGLFAVTAAFNRAVSNLKPTSIAEKVAETAAQAPQE